MFYFIIIGAYLVFVAMMVFVCHRLGKGWITKLSVIVVLLLAPFWDIFLTKGIIFNFARQNTPLQKITRTIEGPESVLWIDNVWPGFDKYGRHWMVESYLDGVHLATLALNDDKGNLHVYRSTAGNFSESAELWSIVTEAKKIFENKFEKAGWQITKELVPYQFDYFKKRDEFQKLRKQEALSVFDRKEIYSLTDGNPAPADLAQFNYMVQIDRIRLPEWQEKFVWCDVVTIFDLKNKEIIANNKRCLAYSPMIAIIMVGASPFEGGLRLGDERAYEFDDKVLFEYADLNTTESMKNLFEKSAYRRAFLRWGKNNN